MAWQQTSSKQYARPCDGNEVFLHTLASATAPLNRAHWTINLIASISASSSSPHTSTTSTSTTSNPTTAQLKSAWLHTRHRAPFIACLITTTDSSSSSSSPPQLVYEIPEDAEAQEQWLAESFFVEQAEGVDEFLAGAGARPRRYCSLHYFEGTGQLVLRLHHWIVDGMGALAVLDLLLGFLAEGDLGAPSFGDEHQRLPPSHHVAAGFPDSPSPAATAHATQMFTDLISNLPAVGLPLSPPSPGAPPSGIRKITHRLSPHTSALISSASKSRGLSVGAAVHAAIVVATQSNASAATAGCNYTSLAAFNHRPYLLPPYNDVRAWPTGAYIVGPPFTLPPGDFETQARKIYEVYHQPMRRGETQLFDAYGTFSGLLLRAVMAEKPEGAPPQTTPQLSSLGKVDGVVREVYVGKAGRVELLNVEVAVDQIVEGVILYAWSFRGRICLSVVYNEAMYGRDWIRRFFEQVLDELFDGLGVQRPEGDV